MNEVLQLKPEQVEVGSNVRFSLKKEQKDQLKASILEEGGVLQPVLVVPIDKPENGVTHRLVDGGYRHAAVSELNAEQNAGLTLPAIIVDRDEALGRLKTQVAMNIQREDMSPMDRAIAADQMLKAGVARAEIRRVFASAGRKGETTPISNAMLNILLRFLDLPKTMQERIHDGRLGIAAAYELGRVPPDKRQQVLDRAEEERLRFIAQEEKDEEKFLTLQSKQVEKAKEADETVTKLEAAREELARAKALVSEKELALKEAQSQPFKEVDEPTKKKVMESIAAATADQKGAAKTLKDAQNNVAKLLTKSKSAQETAAELSRKLEEARKLAKKRPPTKAIGPKEVKEAAKVEGASTGQIPLNLAQIKDAIKEGADQKDYPKVAAIFKHVQACFAGGPTPKEMVFDIALRVTGEAKAPGVPAKK
jgi:ParB/RepB/Spo0J family partition protein